MATKEEVAYSFAQADFTIEPGIQQIFRLIDDEHEDEPDDPVKLLMVNEETLPYGITPIYLRVSVEFPLPISIIDITPEEYDRLRACDPNLKLPLGWRFAYPIECAAQLQEIKA